MGNRESVRAYYLRSRSKIIARKTVHRTLSTGVLPSIDTCIKHNIPVTLLSLAFNVWCLQTHYPHLIQTRAERMCALVASSLTKALAPPAAL